MNAQGELQYFVTVSDVVLLAAKNGMAITKAIAEEWLKAPETGAEIEEIIDQHIVSEVRGLFVPEKSKVPNLQDLGLGFAEIESRVGGFSVDTLYIHPDDVPAFFDKTAYGGGPKPTAFAWDGGFVCWLWGAEVKTDSTIDRSKAKVIRLVGSSSKVPDETVTEWV